MKDIMVKTNRGDARWLGKAEDDYRIFNAIEYEDIKVNGKWYSVGDYNTFTAYTDEGELICGSPEIIDSLKGLRSKYNLTVTQISDRFEIPYRTVQNWNAGVRECPSYVIKMMDEILSENLSPN